MRKIKLATFLGTLLICGSLSRSVVYAQTPGQIIGAGRAVGGLLGGGGGTQDKPKKEEPKNVLGLTKKQNTAAELLAQTCSALAKEMADNKKTLNDLSADQKKIYNECELIWKSLFLDMLKRFREQKVKEATATQSTEALTTTALLLVAGPNQSNILHESILEQGIEGEISGYIEVMTEILLELLDEADRNGYTLPESNIASHPTDSQLSVVLE